MDRKKKVFKPIITRVKLNPEQAVLSCYCYSDGWEIQTAPSASRYGAASGLIVCFGSKSSRENAVSCSSPSRGEAYVAPWNPSAPGS